MTLLEFELKEANHLVAMEYYWLMLNRTHLVLLTPQYLIGLKANGFVSAEGGADMATLLITKKMAISGDLENPYSYLKQKYIEKIAHLDVLGEQILAKDKANFRIDRRDIVDVTHDPSKKWGMGYYPHDGKVYVKTSDNQQREFIILGNQSGKMIKNWILSTQ